MNCRLDWSRVADSCRLLGAIPRYWYKDPAVLVSFPAPRGCIGLEMDRILVFGFGLWFGLDLDLERGLDWIELGIGLRLDWIGLDWILILILIVEWIGLDWIVVWSGFGVGSWSGLVVRLAWIALERVGQNRNCTVFIPFHARRTAVASFTF